MGSCIGKKKIREIIEISRILLKICGAEGSRIFRFNCLLISILLCIFALRHQILTSIFLNANS